jgi:hypothetical protein
MREGENACMEKRDDANEQREREREIKNEREKEKRPLVSV